MGIRCTQIIGLPEENVELKEGIFRVNEKALDSRQFPVPSWMRNLEFSIVVPQNTYFVCAEFRGTRYNAEIAAQACLVRRDWIYARAFMRWWPMRRRGFIGTAE